MKSFKGKTNFYFSIVQDQDINLLNSLANSKYYRLLGLTRVTWYCYIIMAVAKGPVGQVLAGPTFS